MVSHFFLFYLYHNLFLFHPFFGVIKYFDHLVTVFVELYIKICIYSCNNFCYSLYLYLKEIKTCASWLDIAPLLRVSLSVVDSAL